MRNLVAFYPYYSDGEYIQKMRYFIETMHKVIDYKSLKEGLYGLSQVRTIYLNWIENELDEQDIQLLRKAKILKINVVWVFHNRLTHDAKDTEKSISKIKFLMGISNKIILHSKKSIEFLREYNKHLDTGKAVYIPHPEFTGEYDFYGHIKPDEKLFTFAIYGLVRPYKNIELLINAFKKLKEKEKCRLIIAGKPVSSVYAERLKGLAGKDVNILFVMRRISALEMGSWLNATDVLVLPYSIKSSMNSGVMIMAFSYKKTVIVSRIAMAEEFPDDLIYKYSCQNEQESEECLREKMELAYVCGKEKNAEKGKRLFEIVRTQNANELVKRKLQEIV